MNELAVAAQQGQGGIVNLPSAQVIETAGMAAAAKQKALVEARYTVALHRPRDSDAVRQKLLLECKRPSFAAVARYVKPIGPDKTKWPTGASIRFAEAAIRLSGNISVDCATIHDDREKRILSVSVSDLETNATHSTEITINKTIERRKAKEGDVVVRTRTNSYGDTVYILEATDDDIQNKQNALLSKAIRTQGLRLIPGDLIDECMWLVQQTQKKADAADPDGAKNRIFDGFFELGVSAEQVKEYLGHPAEKLTPAELQELRLIYVALQGGEVTWRDVMDARTASTDAGDKGAEPEKKGAVDKVAAALGKAGEKLAAKSAAKGAAKDAPAAPSDAAPTGGKPEDNL